MIKITYATDNRQIFTGSRTAYPAPAPDAALCVSGSMWAYSRETFEEFIIVACVVEADRESQIRNGSKILFGIHQLFGGFINPVFHQIFKGAHLQGSRKAAAALALADVDTVGDFLQSQRFRVMGSDKKHCLLDALFILRHTRGGNGFRVRELTQQFRPKVAQISLGGNLIAEMFCHIYLDYLGQCLQHPLMPRRTLIQKKDFKKLVVLHRQQVLRLQVIALVPEDVVRMKDKGVEGALLLSCA